MANDSRYQQEVDQILSDAYFDGELPADILAEHPSAHSRHYRWDRMTTGCVGGFVYLFIFGIFLIFATDWTAGNEEPGISKPAGDCAITLEDVSPVNVYSLPSDGSYTIGRIMQSDTLDYLGSWTDEEGEWHKVDSYFLGEGWVKASDSVLVGDGC